MKGFSREVGEPLGCALPALRLLQLLLSTARFALPLARLPRATHLAGYGHGQTLDELYFDAASVGSVAGMDRNRAFCSDELKPSQS
jgi:hypothetical protein